MGNGRWHKGVSGALWAEEHEITRALAARIGNSPGALKLVANMRAVAWGKLLINLNNAVNALSGRTLLEQLSDRDYRRVVAASQVEALEILEAAGIEPAQLGPIPPKLLPHALADHGAELVERRLLHLEDVHAELGLDRVAHLPGLELRDDRCDVRRERLGTDRSQGAAVLGGLLVVGFALGGAAEVGAAAQPRRDRLRPLHRRRLRGRLLAAAAQPVGRLLAATRRVHIADPRLAGATHVVIDIGARQVRLPL
jgi:hypothetical protein